AEHEPDRQSPAAGRERAGDERHADRDHRERQQADRGAVELARIGHDGSERLAGSVERDAAWTAAQAATASTGAARLPLADSMITRQGRSASTVSSVRPKTEPPPRSGSGITIARAPIARASSTIAR